MDADVGFVAVVAEVGVVAVVAEVALVGVDVVVLVGELVGVTVGVALVPPSLVGFSVVADVPSTKVEEVALSPPSCDVLIGLVGVAKQLDKSIIEITLNIESLLLFIFKL